MKVVAVVMSRIILLVVVVGNVVEMQGRVTKVVHVNLFQEKREGIICENENENEDRKGKMVKGKIKCNEYEINKIPTNA